MKLTCLNCWHQFDGDVSLDELGWHSVCPKCGSSFDVDVPEEEAITNKGITVEELYIMCFEELKRGNGRRHILISGDDEGNSFHTLFYGFDSSSQTIDYALVYEHDSHKANEVIVLG